MPGFVLRASGLGFVWGFGFMACGCRMLPGLFWGNSYNASNPDPVPSLPKCKSRNSPPPSSPTLLKPRSRPGFRVVEGFENLKS